MHCSITALPFEILVNVASYLNFEDFVNLKLTRKELFETLHSERISREAVRVRNRACNGSFNLSLRRVLKCFKH